jgi:dipeptidase
MCDTQILIKNGSTYFAKNSDREPNEIQIVVRIPPVENDKTPKLKTTYLEIPQSSKRYGVILSKPFWIWGAEMGVNDQGVAIGNQALFTKVHDKTPGLIGMDLLRLALERSESSLEALNVITELLEEYGQGGACGYQDKSFVYDNSFIIADPKEAWVLETANRHWVAKRVKNFAAISNCLTIESDFDLHSKGLHAFARKEGLYKQGDFNFSKTFGTWFLTYFSGAKERLKTSQCLLEHLSTKDNKPLQSLINTLRSHKSPNPLHFYRSNDDLCMHACGYVRRGQTCGSMVAMLSNESKKYFFTGTSSPCLSIFKPINFDHDFKFSVLTESQETPTLWEKHEFIHHHFLFNFNKEFFESRNSIEQKILELVDYKEADTLVSQWENYWYQYSKENKTTYPFSLYGLFWKKLKKSYNSEKFFIN